MTAWGVSDAVVRYGGRTALACASLEADAGAIAAVVGADGAGKTTLLRVLAGARDPDEGEVRRPPRQRIGFLSGSSGVYGDLTVDENLEFAARAYRVARRERRVAELLAATRLEEARDRLGAQLSGGMRQKLGVAAAMIHRPDLLVLDEPTTGLDPVSRVEIWGLLGDAAAGGAAVVVSTAYVEEAERASTVLILDDGQPLVVGSAAEVLASVPGKVVEGADRPDGLPAWRRGRRWHAWVADGRRIRGARAVRPDMEDAVMVAALAREPEPEAG